MSDLVSLAVYTYRQLVCALDDEKKRFLRFVDPSSPWVVPSICNSDTLPGRLLEFKRMLDSKIGPQDRAAFQSQLSVEICKMKAELNVATSKQDSAIAQDVLIKASWRIDDSVPESIAKIDLNAVFKCRQLFSSMVQQSSELSLRDHVRLEEAITSTYRAMVWSGLNDVLIAEQNYLRLFLNAAIENEQFSAGARRSKQENELPKDWGIANVQDSCDWLAVAKGGLKITGAIIALALVINDDPVRGVAFAAVWNPFVEMLDGGMSIRDAYDPQASAKNQGHRSKAKAKAKTSKAVNRSGRSR